MPPDEQHFKTAPQDRNRRGISDLPLLKKITAIYQKSRKSSFWEVSHVQVPQLKKLYCNYYYPI